MSIDGRGVYPIPARELKDVSCIIYESAFSHCGHYKTEYYIDSWVKPRIGSFFAFEKYIDARRFLSSFGSMRSDLAILLAESKYISYPAFDILPNSKYGIVNFWTNNYYVSGGCIKIPEGTILCDSIKLIRELQI